LFGVTDNGGGDSVKASVVDAAKKALSRMPVIDLKVLRKRQEENFGSASMLAGNSAEASSPAPGGDLLDLNDMFGSGAPAQTPAAQNGGNGDGEAPKSDLDLLSDIFAASSTATPLNTAPTGVGVFDLFSAAQSSGGPTPQPAAPVNPIDIFGGSPTMSTPALVPASQTSNPLDIFGAPPPVQSQTQPAVEIATPNILDVSASNAKAGPFIVPAFTHEGLTVEFECTKPEIWNKQNSELIAKCKNASPDALYGFNLQCAVPKYIIMEMQPPSSTTVPVTGVNNSTIVTQKIKVTNTRMGEKNLVLKIKACFTLQGKKIEHMVTCSGFPAGEY